MPAGGIFKTRTRLQGGDWPVPTTRQVFLYSFCPPHPCQVLGHRAAEGTLQRLGGIVTRRPCGGGGKCVEGRGTPMGGDTSATPQGKRDAAGRALNSSQAERLCAEARRIKTAGESSRHISETLEGKPSRLAWVCLFSAHTEWPSLEKTCPLPARTYSGATLHTHCSF